MTALSRARIALGAARVSFGKRPRFELVRQTSPCRARWTTRGASQPAPGSMLSLNVPSGLRACDLGTEDRGRVNPRVWRVTLGASHSHRPVEPQPVTSTDTDPAEEEKAQSRSARFMIHPLALKKRCWDWFIMLLVRPFILRTRTIVPEECLTAHAGEQVLYSLIMVPWMVAFTTQGSCGSAQANQCLPIAFKVSLHAKPCALYCIYTHRVIAVRGHCRGCVFLG
jgi:hypothetical protein